MSNYCTRREDGQILNQMTEWGSTYEARRDGVIPHSMPLIRLGEIAPTGQLQGEGWGADNNMTIEQVRDLFGEDQLVYQGDLLGYAHLWVLEWSFDRLAVNWFNREVVA